MSEIEFLDLAQKMEDQLVSWRQTIHQNPELGYQEHQTAGLVADALNSFGLDVQTGVGKTGVLGKLGSGKPAIGLRADMDALAIQEENDLPYSSRNPGVMHACGHDAHTSMLLGCAALLSDLPDGPPGEIRFLFQPMEEAWDEEGKGGALRMLEEGALDGLDAVAALHVDSTIPCGTVAVSAGPVMAGVDPYDVVIQGTSSHSGSPHQGVNPIAILAQIIQNILAIPPLYTDPLQPGLISCEAVQGGSSSGVIPGEASLHGNIRYYDSETRQAIHRALENVLKSVRSQGADFQLSIQGIYPPTENDPEMTGLIRSTAQTVFGQEWVVPLERSLAGEDFGYMSGKVPGVYFHLGAGLEGDFRPYHNPHFDIDESALPVGTALLSAAAVRFLEDHR
jgi:amidohydrolase